MLLRFFGLGILAFKVGEGNVQRLVLNADANFVSVTLVRITSICRSHIRHARLGRMSHPDPHGPPDRTPIEVGEVWENPVTGERATILEHAWDNPARRATAELTALVGGACRWGTSSSCPRGAIHRPGG